MGVCIRHEVVSWDKLSMHIENHRVTSKINKDILLIQDRELNET